MLNKSLIELAKNWQNIQYKDLKQIDIQDQLINAHAKMLNFQITYEDFKSIFDVPFELRNLIFNEILQRKIPEYSNRKPYPIGLIHIINQYRAALTKRTIDFQQSQKNLEVAIVCDKRNQQHRIQWVSVLEQANSKLQAEQSLLHIAQLGVANKYQQLRNQTGYAQLKRYLPWSTRSSRQPMVQQLQALLDTYLENPTDVSHLQQAITDCQSQLSKEKNLSAYWLGESGMAKLLQEIKGHVDVIANGHNSLDNAQIDRNSSPLSFTRQN